jgi:4-hydroxybenzoate polyprenyltransferase
MFWKALQGYILQLLYSIKFKNEMVWPQVLITSIGTAGIEM